MGARQVTVGITKHLLGTMERTKMYSGAGGRLERSSQLWAVPPGKHLRNRDVGGKPAMQFLRLGWLYFSLPTMFSEREA